MLDGLVSVTVEDEELAVGPEGFVLVPRGTAHTFGNAAQSEARLLVIHAPAMDAYFRRGTRADGPVRHGAGLMPPAGHYGRRRS